MSNNSSQKMVFLEETESSEPKKENLRPWKILIVDDEPLVHQATLFALKKFVFDSRDVEFYSCFGYQEAKEFLTQHRDIALVILDVVMEESNSGLELVHFVRDTLKDSCVQIIIRTGQPGDTPSDVLISQFEINDYGLKTEFTREKLYAAVLVSLRTYRDYVARDDMKKQLQEANENLAIVNQTLESRVSNRTKDLEESLASNRLLLRTLTHDLRNFFAAILLRCLEAQGSTLKEYENHCQRIYEQTGRMNAFVNQVVMWEGMAARKVVPDFVPFPLKDLIDEALDLLSSQAAKKGVTLKKEFNETEGLSLLVEPATFGVTVLNNLISNAIKFSPESATVTVSCKKSGENMIEINVVDEGIGIPENILKNLFSPGAKTSRTGTKGEKGTGFGMPLVKRYLEMMGGTIQVETTIVDFGDKKSSQKSGTLVRILVPRSLE